MIQQPGLPFNRSWWPRIPFKLIKRNKRGFCERFEFHRRLSDLLKGLIFYRPFVIRGLVWHFQPSRHRRRSILLKSPGLFPAAITCRVPVLKGLVNQTGNAWFFSSFVNTRTDSVCFGINSAISVIFVQASGTDCLSPEGRTIFCLCFVPLWIPIMTLC